MAFTVPWQAVGKVWQRAKEQEMALSESSPCWLTGWVTALPSFCSFSNQGNSNFPRTSFKAGLDAEHSCATFPLLTIPCALLYLFLSRRHNPSKHTVSWGRKRCCGAVAAPKQKQDLQFTADRPCKCLRWPETSSHKKGEVRGKFKLGDFHSSTELLPCWGKRSHSEHCFESRDCCCTLRVGRRQPTVADMKTQELQLLQLNSFLDSEKNQWKSVSKSNDRDGRKGNQTPKNIHWKISRPEKIHRKQERNPYTGKAKREFLKSIRNINNLQNTTGQEVDEKNINRLQTVTRFLEMFLFSFRTQCLFQSCPDLREEPALWWDLKHWDNQRMLVSWCDPQANTELLWECVQVP